MKKVKIKKLFVPILLMGLLLYFFVIQPIIKIKKDSSLLIASAKQLKATFSKNNIDLLNSQYLDFAKKYSNFEKSSKRIYWASFIPYVADYKNFVEAGSYLVKAGGETIVAIEPYADLIGFKKGEKSFVEKSAEDRLQTAVLTLDKVLSKIDNVSNYINEAEKRIELVNPDRYPKKIGKLALRDNVINIKEQFKGASSLFVDAKPLIKKLPEILGSKREMTYLFLFQNDKERRATGGFLTFYTIFKVNKGKLSIYRSDDIYSLDATIGSHPVAPREILTYHKGVTELNIRDSNLSPDFVESVKIFESLYQKSGAKVPYDGIIAVDSKILVDMLKIFGDTQAAGLTFSAENDSRCDCAQVIYQLFDIVDRPVGYLKENRKGILGDLMYALFYKAIGFSPSKYWGTLAQTMYKNMQEKHILLNFKDKDLQKSVEKLKFAGKINNYSGDYLHINSVNFAGAKSNLFVNETITSKTTVSSKNVTREVTVEYRNPYPHSDCNLERGGLCLNATLRNWVRVYVPKGSKLIEFQGSLKKVQTYDDLGKTVFEGYLEVPTQGKATIVVKYTVPSEVISGKYSLLFEKQAGVESQKLEVIFNKKTLFKDVTTSDQEIKSL
ncbi:MAG: hypothetical protein UR68_C0001G0008 [Candidatus Roizmanbacteria bacterium GW2011_GWA2_35_19]|uniref:DUF4012 domain-containing protein n=2 Tax=Candidatus Roizmaniibacteriota TaxID=1752723 RepID=A0A0G0BYW8_9BACT|nr:MAG: hypothetical protein UR63_C0001G0008 [Candidatus Roizmanbacteria bacterium GW2011_GWC2_35_12]KKP74408.1 MAG: hypothetical protein UR68_C0001G0008 [Candidatus Roizmanbacteria bacterium GW2011_GWA2_35_19]